MPNSKVLSDIRKVAVCTFIGVVIMAGVFALLGHFSAGVVLGGLLGGFTAVANLFLLAVTIEKSVDKGAKGSRGLMGISYLARIAIIAAVVIFAIKNTYLNYLATVIPLVFPQIIIKILYTKQASSEEKNQDEC